MCLKGNTDRCVCVQLKTVSPMTSPLHKMACHVPCHMPHVSDSHMCELWSWPQGRMRASKFESRMGLTNRGGASHQYCSMTFTTLRSRPAHTMCDVTSAIAAPFVPPQPQHPGSPNHPPTRSTTSSESASTSRRCAPSISPKLHATVPCTSCWVSASVQVAGTGAAAGTGSVEDPGHTGRHEGRVREVCGDGR